MCNGTHRGLVSAQTDPMNILEDDSQGVSEVSRLDVDVDHELQGRFLCLGHQSAILWESYHTNQRACEQRTRMHPNWSTRRSAGIQRFCTRTPWNPNYVCSVRTAIAQHSKGLTLHVPP